MKNVLTLASVPEMQIVHLETIGVSALASQDLLGIHMVLHVHQVRIHFFNVTFFCKKGQT